MLFFLQKKLRASIHSSQENKKEQQQAIQQFLASQKTILFLALWVGLLFLINIIRLWLFVLYLEYL
jgi:hypothetical protein